MTSVTGNSLTGCLSATKKASTEQAWSMESLDKAKKESNTKILTLVAHMLKKNPELHCKLQGSTDADPASRPNKALAVFFQLESAQSIQNELARRRAMACKQELVARGVPVEQLLVTWAGYGTQNKVDFCLMEPDEALAGKKAWEGKAAERARKRFHNELGKQRIQFDFANPNATDNAWSRVIKPIKAAKTTSSVTEQALSIMTEQAWSIEPLNVAKAATNSKILDLVANTLKSCPELRCKLHGRTDNDRGDADLNTALAAYFNLVSAQSTQDELARLRAMACKDELVARGVPDERLLVTWAGRGKFSTVDFFAMERAKASTEETAWGREAATRALKRFDDELKQKDIHFDYDSTNMAELAWRSWHVEDPAKRALNSRMIKEMTEQAWSIESLDPSKAALNSKALDVVANTLKSYPELRCKLHGSTDADPVARPDKALAEYFQLETAHSIQDELARLRAIACKHELVARGVQIERLFVTWEGYGEQSNVAFLPMDMPKAVAEEKQWDARRQKDQEELAEEKEKHDKGAARLKQLKMRETLENTLAKKHIQFDCAGTSTRVMQQQAYSIKSQDPAKATSNSEIIKLVADMQQQAYSIKSQDPAKATSNSEIIKLVADTLENCPDLHCKLHGSTGADLGDGDLNEQALAAHFRLESKLSIQDALAQGRAEACKEALVGLGVPVERLLVTWAGRGTQSKVDFCLMEPVGASAEKAAWEGKAAARARMRFNNELNKRHIQFECASTNVKDPWSIKPLTTPKKGRGKGLALMKKLIQAQIAMDIAMKRAWSIRSRDLSTATSNFKTLALVADMLKKFPELHCKLHGSTDTTSRPNRALAAYFHLESSQSVQDELAQKRAKVCKDELVARGVPGERLLVTWASCGEHSKVDFFPMEPAEAMAEKAIWKVKAAETVNIFKETVNAPINETAQHTVDLLRAKTCD